MKQTLNKYTEKNFEDIKHIDEYGNEYWLARELQKALRYKEWRNFELVVNKAKKACENSDFNVFECFVDINKTSKMPNGGVKQISDYKLSRYACYLIVQNGDPNKKVIALGQTYFAIQTRRQEVTEQEYDMLDETEKRFYQRNLTKRGNYTLQQTAAKAGVKNMAEFHNAGYKGLYNGETADAKQEENYKNGGKFISDNNLRKEITILKQSDLHWLNEVSNNVAKQAVKDGCEAYKKFFKGLADIPRFKSRKKAKPSFYNDTSKLKVKENSVLIEKVGWITIKKNSIPMNCKYTNPRVSFDGKYWFIAIGIEKENPIVELTTESIGIDVGIKDLAICSNGMIFKNINKTRVVKQLKKRIRRLQRKVSCKYLKNKEGGTFVKTSNIIKIENKIKLLHRKLTNIRSNHNHQATNKIVKAKPSRIVMETLNIKSMMKNKHLSKAIAEQCLYEFKRQVKYKCEIYGIEFIEADKWYPSSKTCSACGNVKTKLLLSERSYICENCGCIIDRDYNASINLSRYELVV